VRGGYLRVGGLQVHHVYGGAGELPVLFVHGLGSAGYLEWRFTLPAVAHRHRVLALDLPGFGRSDQPRDGYGIPMFADVVEGYIRALGIRPALVGTSMGGRVALEVALRSPDLLRKVVLVDALGVVRPNVQPFYPLVLLPRVGETVLGLMREALQHLPPVTIQRYARRFVEEPEDVERVMDAGFLASMREMYSTEGYARAYASTVRALADPDARRSTGQLARLAGTRLPVLLIWGEGDRLLPAERAREAVRTLPGARLEVIERAGHTPQAERPDRFNRVLEDFLAD